jgi:ABC-type Fe3+-hydroxamate transport system substrate-binding protein
MQQTTPYRIVSLVPSLTAFLTTIGCAERLIGITDLCPTIPEYADLPLLGGTKNPAIASIIALQPDLVLTSTTDNLPTTLRELEAAGLTVYQVQINSVREAVEQLSQLARLLGCGGAPLLQELRSAYWRALERPADAPRPRVLALAWRDPWMAIGDETYANDLLTLCGAQNVALELAGRQPRTSLERLLSLNPAIILLPDWPYAFSEADEAVFARHADVAAVRLGQIYLCEGRWLHWYGAQTVAALRVFGELFGGER